MRVHVGRKRKGGVDVIDVEGVPKEDAPPVPLVQKQKAQPPPPQGDTAAPPPPQKAPRTATPAEWAEPAAGRGQRGAVGAWVEQQHQLQRAGAWEVCAMSAEAANRELEACLSKANEDRRAAKTGVADLTKERDRLAAKVKTLERDSGRARKATGDGQSYQHRQGRGLTVPRAERWRGRGGGGGNAAGFRYLLASTQA